jgi:hypothetical protein
LATYTLFGQGAVSTPVTADTAGATLGVEDEITLSGGQAAQVDGVWWYSAAGAGILPDWIGTAFYNGTGFQTGEGELVGSWSGAPGSGWVFAAFASPPGISTGTKYLAMVSSPGGADWYAGEHHFWDAGAGAGGITNGPLSAPNNAGSQIGQGSFNAIQQTPPNSTFQSTNYWIDPQVTVTGGGGTAHTRTASLTVAPSFSASRARGKFRTASLTVTPGFAVTRTAGHVRTASLTVPFAFRAVPSGGHAKLERQLVRLAVASYFGGAKVTADAGTCFQGGPLTAFGLGTAYPYTVRNVPDEYYTAGMPAGQNWGAVMSTTRVERNTRLDSYGGQTSGYWARRYTIECEIALICELPHIEVAGAALDDLIDKVHALIYADRTLGTNGGASGLQILQAGAGRAGIRDVTGKFAALDEVKGRYAAEATVTFEALTMVTA